MNGNGLSAGDVLALSRDRGDGFFGDGIWGIIMLLIVAGLFTGNGFGWGNRGNVAETDIDTRFLERDIFNTNQNVSNTACQTQRDVLEAKYNLGSQIQENRFNCSQNACATQKEILESRYTTQLGFQTQQAQTAQCCCDLKTAIHAEGEATRNMIQQDKIEQLRDQVYATNLALNNANLANTVINAVRPTPTPAYLTCSPYFAYNNTFGCNGCGNSLY